MTPERRRVIANEQRTGVSESGEASQVLRIFQMRLVEAGLKSTRQRDAIVELFFEINRHISVQELHDAVKVVYPNIGYATVYRTLKILVDIRLANPRDFGDGITRFDPLIDKPDQHDHLICLDCREVFEFKDMQFDQRQDAVAASLGSFKIARRKLEFYAHCTKPNCKRRSK